MQDFDVVIIGSGPGGYICAFRCAQLGFRTACIEKDSTFGGTCLNVGCIPSKALLESSYLYFKNLHEASEHGVQFEKIKMDVAKFLKRKDKVVSTLTSGVAMLMKKNKITTFQGMGSLQSPNEVLLTNSKGEKTTIKAKHIVIATGSVAGSLPGVRIDEDRVVSSTGALNFNEIPKELVVIGGGYIGLELGSVWSRLGSSVEVIEFQDRILPNMDETLSEGLLKSLQKQGVKFSLGTAVQSVETQKGQVAICVKSKNEERSLKADRVLVSVGRKPFTEGLGLESLGISLNRGFLVVDEEYRTKVPSVFAIGDVIGGAMLAHKAEEEGVAVAEIIAGQRPRVEYHLVPGILYTHPEVASVGLSESELKAKKIDYKKGQFSLKANGRAISMGETDGFVKILADKKTDEILGAHIMAPNASELIHEICIAMEFSAKAEDIAMTMHGHPTLSEAVKEAALAVHQRTLNS